MTNSGVYAPQSGSIERELLDLSGLVGREVSLFSEQLPGREIKVRVLSVSGRQIHVEGIRQNAIDNLVINQTIILQFPYKGERISVRAVLRRSAGGRCYFQMEEKVVPLSQRKHRRVGLAVAIRLAPFPVSTFSRKNLGRLRWIETETANFSSGGVLLEIPSYLESGVYLLMNLGLKTEVFPKLVVGKVRHCHSTENNRFRVGVEFLVKEVATQTIPPSTAKELPPVAFSYSVLDREKLNRIVQAWTPGTDNPLL